jgi:ribosomal protein S12 methylthiotransferase accessory factor
MASDTVAPPSSGLWHESAALLSRLVDAGAAARRPGPRVRVEVLGGRDELQVDAVPVGGTGGGEVPVHLFGHHAVVGPVARPAAHGRAGEAPRPCARCLARRWQTVRIPALRDALELGGQAKPVGELPAVTPFVADLLACLATAHAESAPVEAVRRTAPVHHVDLDRLTVRRHRLVPDPECPWCGRAVDDSPAEMDLGHPAKHDATAFRLRTLADHDLDIDAFANPVCGAAGTGVLPDLASFSTAAVSGGFTTRSGTYLRRTLWGGHADSYSDSARIGVLEALERSAGIRPRARRPSVVGSLDDLGDLAVDPRRLGLYSAEFHREHPEVPAFSPERSIRWVWGYSLRDQRPVLIPEVVAYYQTPGRRERFVQSSSSGCATGSCLAEAVYSGLMEAVERDAFLIAWYGGALLPEIDPQSSSRPRTRQMVDRLSMYGYEARFFDTRITFPVPVVTGVAVRRDGGLGTLCVGGGASMDPEAALAAALCEIATDAVNLRARAGRDEARLRAMAEDFDRVLELHDHPLSYGIPEMAANAAFLVGRPGEPRRTPLPVGTVFGGDRPPPPLSLDLAADVAWCVGAVADAGFDVVVVDQTLPEQRDLGLVTVNVLVPGLVPIDFGWQRQRALHMPRVRTALREAGLVDHDLAPEELHRVPHPFP